MGRELERAATELRPDVIVVDIGMPNLNGLEAIRQLQKENARTVERPKYNLMDKLKLRTTDKREEESLMTSEARASHGGLIEGKEQIK